MILMTTIFGLASGHGRCGVSVVRISGPRALACAQKLCPALQEIPANQALYTPLYTKIGVLLDKILLLYFKAPRSFTGEDVVEFHCHGSSYIVETLLGDLANEEGCRLAEPGEFTRRAFENGKLDLTQVEGLYDLIHAQTDAQHHMALGQLNGALSQKYDLWRDALIKVLSYSEAAIDFADEELPEAFSEDIHKRITSLKGELEGHLENSYGEQIREGFSVVIIGEPNVGKSSFLNHIANRDVAIVSDIAGTTRDMIEVSLNIKGHKVVFVDTAGLTRTPKDAIEEEGIQRARARADNADLKLLLLSVENPLVPEGIEIDAKTLVLLNKSDKGMHKELPNLGNAPHFMTSVKENKGISEVLSSVGERLSALNKEAIPLTRVRHRVALEKALGFLEQAFKEQDIGLKTESLRLAVYEIGRITGHVDVEDLLDVIFSDFCIGK